MPVAVAAVTRVAVAVAAPFASGTNGRITNAPGCHESTSAGEPLRPCPIKASSLAISVDTCSGDGSGRVFVGIQQGTIHVFPNDQAATETKVFLDIASQVRYSDAENEEGMLGLAFHPKYKTNGEFFVFYTDRKAKLTNVVSRFRVSKDDPNKADPDSAQLVLEIADDPYINHNGGTVRFGPDGYLYWTTGDGGLAGDPFENAQNIRNHFGKIFPLKGRAKKITHVGQKMDLRDSVVGISINFNVRVAYIGSRKLRLATRKGSFVHGRNSYIEFTISKGRSDRAHIGKLYLTTHGHTAGDSPADDAW